MPSKTRFDRKQFPSNKKIVKNARQKWPLKRMPLKIGSIENISCQKIAVKK